MRPLDERVRSWDEKHRICGCAAFEAALARGPARPASSSVLLAALTAARLARSSNPLSSHAVPATQSLCYLRGRSGATLHRTAPSKRPNHGTPRSAPLGAQPPVSAAADAAPASCRIEVSPGNRVAPEVTRTLPLPQATPPLVAAPRPSRPQPCSSPRRTARRSTSTSSRVRPWPRLVQTPRLPAPLHVPHLASTRPRSAPTGKHIS